MKRKGNLYQQICSIQNLELADSLARKGKLNQYGVKIHDKNKVANVDKLHNSLISKKYKTQ